MTYATKSILWILTGPIASLVLGYGAFLSLGFILGPGFDIDDVGTPTEKFFGRLTLPAAGAIVVGGSLVSFVMGIRYFLAHHSLAADSYPRQADASDPRRTKAEGESGRSGD